MQQAAEEGCVLRGLNLVCFHLLKLQRIFTFRHQLLHLILDLYFPTQHHFSIQLSV